MADHLRKQIRDAAVTALTGLATTGARVFRSRTLAVPPEKRPCLLVYTKDEDAERDSMGADPGILRTLDLMVVGQGDATRDLALDDLLDRMALEVEVALMADKTLGGLAMTSVIATSEHLLTGEGEVEQGAVMLTFEVIYRSRQSDPSQAA